MLFKKRRSVVSEEEKLLKHLLTLDRDEKNTISFGIQRYRQVPGFEPDQVVQTLVALDDAGYIKVNFCGHVNAQTFCFIQIRESGLTYFEDQDADYDQRKNDKRHDYKVAISSAIVGAILSVIIMKIIETLL